MPPESAGQRAHRCHPEGGVATSAVRGADGYTRL